MKYLLFFSLIIIGSDIHSQPSIKVFGFEQGSSTGTLATHVKGENGNPVAKAATEKNYFIYLSLNQKHDIDPQYVFIRGEALRVESSIIEATPVQRVNDNIPGKPQQITLVPRTTNKVLKLKIAGPTPLEKTSTFEKLTKKNDVVILYTWKKKKYFAVLKKLEKLEPVLNQ